jgi:hypothetical protein
MYTPIFTRCSIFAILLSSVIPCAYAKTLYVDSSLSSNCTTSYSVDSRSCSGGTSSAYATLSSALDSVSAGDEVILRAGSYEQIAPSISGTAGQPITIKSYTGETASISGLNTIALSIIGKSYIIIDGLTVNNVVGFGRLEDSNNITIRNSYFNSATSTGTTGALKLVRSTNNNILNNTFQNGSDNMVIQDASNNNRIIGNQFHIGSHSLLSIRCSDKNIIRGNKFGNPDQKAVEIYDCEGVSDAPVRLDSTKHNLFENNLFHDTLGYYADHKYNAMQHGGQHTIVRKNVFRNCEGGGVNYQYYSDESLYVYGNRLYNNTFYANSCHGIIGNSGSSSQYYDNRVANNLLYKNVNCDGDNTQVNIDDSSVVILSGNALATSDPQFEDESSYDLSLTENSPHIDTGIFVASATSSGSGSTMTVDDASYFYDGFGIDGEVGDLIQLESSTTTARIISINYDTNTIQLDKSVSWTSGQGIALAYTGDAPDVGAFELSSGSSTTLAPPNPPTDLKSLKP